MSRHIDAVEELIDGALAGHSSDAMRWTPEPTPKPSPIVDLSYGRLSEPMPESMQEAFENLARALTDFLNRVFDVFGPTLHRLVALMDGDESTRHGNASLCPRHGPTKGGLCRRCQR